MPTDQPAEGRSPDVSRTLKLLCLDGGGVRGLSSLYILQELMKEVADDPKHPPKPCHWFHMIGGTSTGGLIAIMLGRLQMSVKACIDVYARMMGDVFAKSRPVLNLSFTLRTKIRARFNTEELERAIKDIIREAGHEGETLRDPGCQSESICKVFVCATEYETTDIHIFSNYHRRGAAFDDIYEDALIWEACRATSAASTFFDPVTIGKSDKNAVVFLDGATKANNPVTHLWEEASTVFGEDFEKRLQLAISIGTGVPDIKAFGKDLRGVAKTMVKLATDTEGTNKTFERGHMSLVRDDRFFRFNVQVGLGSIGLEDVGKQALIRGATHGYLELTDVQRRVEAFKQRAIPGAFPEPSVPRPLPMTNPSQLKDSSHNQFLNLDTSNNYVNRHPKHKSYWARITQQGWAVYEQCFKDMTGDTHTYSVILFEQFHWYLARFSPNFPSITANLIWEIWCRLRVPGNADVPQALPKALAMAALCMAHLEGVVDPHTKPTLEEVRFRGPTRLSDSRLKYLRLFDQWADCACGCGRKWNFVSDPPDALRDDGRKKAEVKCRAEGVTRKRPWKSVMIGKQGERLVLQASQQQNLRAWFALDPADR